MWFTLHKELYYTKNRSLKEQTATKYNVKTKVCSGHSSTRPSRWPLARENNL